MPVPLSCRRLLTLFALLFFALTSCSESAPTSETIFLPPSPAPTNNPPLVQAPPGTPPPTPLPRASSTPTCSDGLTYLEDLTVPDGSSVSPGEEVDKRWQVENSGSCNWEAGYEMRLIEGPALGAQDHQPLFPARSGTQFALRIAFIAPDDPGTYRSAWQAYNPKGEAFGDMVYIEIIVE